jgi:hypothetical protein
MDSDPITGAHEKKNDSQTDAKLCIALAFAKGPSTEDT